MVGVYKVMFRGCCLLLDVCRVFAVLLSVVCYFGVSLCAVSSFFFVVLLCCRFAVLLLCYVVVLPCCGVVGLLWCDVCVCFRGFVV